MMARLSVVWRIVQQQQQWWSCGGEGALLVVHAGFQLGGRAGRARAGRARGRTRQGPLEGHRRQANADIYYSI